MIADIYKSGVLAAKLERFDDHVEFRYVKNYDGEPVASTLPLGSTPVSAPARQLPPFFVGLLPEGRRLTALRRTLKVSADDELSMLLAVGHSTIGDVQVVPVGDGLQSSPDAIVDDSWADADLQAIFEQSVSGLPDAAIDRTAIPGVQPKISGRMISFPATQSSGHVIVKLDPPEYARVTENEYLMLNAARATKLFDVPANKLVTDVTGSSALIVDRFDRRVIDGVNVALPVEDGCQVLGRYPADKYDLDTIDIIDALASNCSAPLVAQLTLLNRVILSLLACDGDLHARNLAIYRDTNGLWRPTPVYDLVSTCPYGDMTFAAPFGGIADAGSVGRRRFLDATSPLGIPRAAVEGLLDKTVASVTPHLLDAVGIFMVDDDAGRRKVLRVIERRAAALTA